MAKNQRRSFEPKIIYADVGKLPPTALDIEQGVLGSFITNYHLIAKFPYLKSEVFYKESHQKIYQALVELYDKDMKPDILILTDYLRTNGDLELVGGPVYLTQLTMLNMPYVDTHVKILMDKYFYRKIINIATIAQSESFEASKDPIDIVDQMQGQIMDMTGFDGDVQNNFNKSLERTIEDIKESAKGENITVIKSGYNDLDRKFTFRSRYICIVAGPEASGKTKFVISIVRGMLDNEPDLAVQWFSFEDGRDQIIRSFMSMDMKKTTKELQSINYRMNVDDIKEMEKCAKKYSKYIIEFYDRATSIENILTRAKRFADKYPDKKRVTIIDNLGLIQCDKAGVDRDDFIAAKIKSIADNNNTSVILVHHFTKEIARKQNIDDGYRPRKEYLKGSTRILDYVQQALFVNLLRKYPDLLSEEKHPTLNFIGSKEIEFTENNFDRYLWGINEQRDKETMSVTDIHAETYAKTAALVCNPNKFPNGKVITFADIIQKYTEYSNYVNTRNKGREDKYKEKKASILTFLVRKMYNESYISSTSSPRSMYLYGENKNLRNHIDDLFIVESVKNRDDDNLNENAIFRFIADLGYNLFTEIENNGNYGENEKSHDRVTKPKSGL